MLSAHAKKFLEITEGFVGSNGNRTEIVPILESHFVCFNAFDVEGGDAVGVGDDEPMQRNADNVAA